MIGRLRLEVISRDDGCVAPRLDPRSGPCRDRWGVERPLRLDELEMDYVRRDATGGRHELASDHVALCPGHHQGTGASAGHVWATAHRADERSYLDRLSGD